MGPAEREMGREGGVEKSRILDGKWRPPLKWKQPLHECPLNVKPRARPGDRVELCNSTVSPGGVALLL